jgi:hypothetical protein
MFGITGLKSCGIADGQKRGYAKTVKITGIVQAAPCICGMKRKILF